MAKQYCEYKEGKAEWIGKIPENWNVTKLKWISNIYSGGTPSTAIDEYWDNGNIPWLNSGTVNQKRITTASNFITKKAVENSSTKWIPTGAIVMALAGQGKTKGTVAILEIDATCNQSMAAIVPDFTIINNEFLFFWLDVNYERIRGLTGTELRDGLNLKLVGDIKCPIPPLEEQNKIAEYLNNKLKLIDQIVNRKLKLVELLKEKRKALINEVLVHGLDSNVTMKKTKIKWLPLIPTNWKLLNFESVANNERYSITGGPFGSDLKNEEYTEKGVRIIQLQNIGVGEFKDEYKIFTSEEKADKLSSCNIYPGDIVIAKMADPVARACIVPNIDNRYIIASDGIRLDVNKTKHNVKFIEYAINSNYFNFQAELNSTGSTRLRIGLNSLKKLKLILPSLVEQNKITNYLLSFDVKYFETQTKLQKQIFELKEYRQSLILEAVTGKIDLRDLIFPNNNKMN